MKIAVIYSSKTGNTKQIAEEIYLALEGHERKFYELEVLTEVPKADMYFIGFPIHNYTCDFKVFDFFEKIENSQIVIFATCGLYPSEEYKLMLRRKISPWINDSCKYLGMFLSQGKATEEYQQRMLNETNGQENIEMLNEIFEDGNSHPNENDFVAVDTFVSDILSN